MSRRLLEAGNVADGKASCALVLGHPITAIADIQTMNRLVLIVSGFGVSVLLLVFPVLHACVVLANLLAHTLVLGLQLVATRLPRLNLPLRRRIASEPFISIHVPAHNEPPELLIQTLWSLSRIHWTNYEVLVIDNNTV